MLYDIITELAAELGRNLQNDTDRRWLLHQINSAARELYFTDDIRGCEQEQLFQLGTTDQQIALPWYVQDVIAVRDYDTRRTVQQVDMRPRYARSGWKKPYLNSPYRQWRQKGDSALSKSLLDETQLTFTLVGGQAADKPFNIYVSGSNSTSSRVVEMLEFAVGDTAKTTSKFFENVAQIRKSAAMIGFDIAVTNGDGEEVSYLPNHVLTTKFTLVQVLDRDETIAQTQLVEVLFKKLYEPFVLDTDAFTAGDIYDKVIYWKTLEHVFAKQDGKEDKAAMCGNKAQSLLNNIISNSAGSIEMEVDFGPNPTLDAFSAYSIMSRQR